MKNIQLLNKIAKIGTDCLDPAVYNIGTEVEAPEGIMVRSSKMHDMTFNKELLAVARAGAGVNNIPVERCAEEGIVVFNTPGANANGVKELAILALILASRDVVGGIEWAKTLVGSEDVAKAVEKGKGAYVGCELLGKTLGVIGLGAIGGMVANAGVVRSGPIADFEKKDFEFVTAINYTGLFLTAKYAAIIMQAQHEADPNASFDIIAMSSKSGLEGSNKNFAYAGSKFGAIGLVQSWALELCAYNIKVNAICPGNYLDGPLWSDPVRGLFVQYLQAGKVPGAKTVEDVRRFYEAKVPMNRGCLPIDVARAVMYCVEQKYETGQAIPVTGGQVMLN